MKDKTKTIQQHEWLNQAIQYGLSVEPFVPARLPLVDQILKLHSKWEKNGGDKQTGLLILRQAIGVTEMYNTPIYTVGQKKK
jgi:hypothetical protein